MTDEPEAGLRLMQSVCGEGPRYFLFDEGTANVGSTVTRFERVIVDASFEQLHHRKKTENE